MNASADVAVPRVLEKSVIQICFGYGSVLYISQHIFSSIAACRIPFKFLELASEIADVHMIDDQILKSKKIGLVDIGRYQAGRNATTKTSKIHRIFWEMRFK